METEVARGMRLEEVKRLILSHHKHLSFNDLIEPNLTVFSELRLMYSTNNIVSDFGYTSLHEIETVCSSLKKFFEGSGLLFFSEDLYKKKEDNHIPLDYSLSLDSNVAEKFRIYENGGKVEPKDKFENLVWFIKKYQFTFDYGFFLLENFEFIEQNNERPFNTLRALKRCNPLNTYPIDREEAGKLAIQTMYNLYNLSGHEVNSYFWQRRKILYLILLGAIQINWETNGDVLLSLKRIVNFCLRKLGKFANKEIYFAWKLFKYGNSLRFFDFVSQPSNKTLSRAKGMSWDLLAIEYQSSLAYNLSKDHNFFVPFFASFDNRFIELTRACPIRCMLFDDIAQRAYTLFDDELEFVLDLNDAIRTDNELLCKFTDPQERIRRSNLQLDNRQLNIQIANLEEAINNI
ncbi:hypothetical protein I8751_03845 [Nostocaceae cyanobacterium CENA357]|uniref:Uncharacterized protein n=1 Tax=Atlanticothrix silvestris CENA357 TaxID=1725252 RepID=A0A8J7HFT3_9CYAN|nr:hypothetical protein [Atlanticothrix silvestris]MBH8551523.1 hypothetical protein [Atlanticothrix silvestris CENA357]